MGRAMEGIALGTCALCLLGGCSAQVSTQEQEQEQEQDESSGWLLDAPAGCEPPLVFGYRGTTLHAPENTLAAFRYAVESGADGVEVDVRKSADGVLVAIHDARVGRTTGDAQDRLVEALTLDELKALDPGSMHSPAFAGERIPTLEEVVAVVPAPMGIVFDLKAPGIERDVADFIAAHGLAARAFVASFYPERTAYVLERHPQVRAGLCLRDMGDLPLAAAARAEFVRIPVEVERDGAHWEAALRLGYRPVVSGKLVDFHVGMVMARDIPAILELRDARRPEHCR